LDRSELEPALAAMLDRKQTATHGAAAYVPRTAEAVAEGLQTFMSRHVDGAVVANVRRMGGGASKEQFLFDLVRPDGTAGLYVLRMDPLQTIIETDRQREFELLRAFEGVVPVPHAAWLDAAGETLGRPFAIMEFTPGVTKPSDVVSVSVSGLQTMLGEHWRQRLGDPFVKYLAAIHAFDWRTADLPSFQVPDGDPFQAARWQVNFWSRVWREDKIESLPIMALTERWLLENLPACEEVVVVHGDYRTGNYLFDEATGEITAILDWELGHLGDFHQDFGHFLQPAFSTVEQGERYVTGLMSREQLIERYEQESGRTVNPRTLHFYEVLDAYMGVAATLGTAIRAAREAANHQDVLLSWLAPCGYIFVSQLCDLLEEEITR
jgi:aminoglycoside phosphotransferase (APT) family kinase protein